MPSSIITSWDLVCLVSYGFFPHQQKIVHSVSLNLSNIYVNHPQTANITTAYKQFQHLSKLKYVEIVIIKTKNLYYQIRERITSRNFCNYSRDKYLLI
jgi:hypothetical protein